MLNDMYKSYLAEAACLGDYAKLTKTQLANGYCDADEAGDEPGRSRYFAALMIRYWYKIWSWNQSSKTLRLEIEDYTTWLVEALNVAFKLRRWRDPSHKLYMDPNGPDKVINMACETIRKRHFYNANLDVRKANYLCDSIDRQIEEFGDAADAMQICEDQGRPDGVSEVIRKLIASHRVLEAIVMDGIAFQDSFKESKTRHSAVDAESGEEYKYYEYSYDFNLKKLAAHLREVADAGQDAHAKFLAYFSALYGIDAPDFESFSAKVSRSDNKRLYSYIKAALRTMAADSSVRTLLGK